MSNFFETPVAVFMFNRPQLTERLVRVLEKIRPSRLLLVADGPRPGNTDDIEKCASVRKLFENPSWDCQVERNFADNNMGSFKRNSSGISWVFDKAEEAILLEDDCIPDLSFFPFCRELLARYRHDDKVGLISGNSFLSPVPFVSRSSYFFSGYATTWGWASWRRTWQNVDLNMCYWEEFRDSGGLGSAVFSIDEQEFWTNLFNNIRANRISNAWDYQLVLAGLKNDFLTVVPSLNLVSNEGFGTEATHCRVEESPLAEVPAHRLSFPLSHPEKVSASKKRDYLIFNRRFGKNHFRRLSGIHPRTAHFLVLLFGAFRNSWSYVVLRKVYDSMPEPVRWVIRKLYQNVRKAMLY